MTDYGKQDLIGGLRAAGVVSGMTIFCHSNIGYFGRTEAVTSATELCRFMYGALRHVIGSKGTLVVPCFSYSFGSEKADRRFNVQETPSTCGAFTEYVRKLPEAIRSSDPMFSIAAIGPAAKALAGDADPECFGENSFWRRFLDREGMIVNLNFDAGSTFIHFVERRLDVPYRKNRTFSGTIVENSKERAAECVFFCRKLDDSSASPRFERFDELAQKAGYVRTSPVGRGSIVAISARNTAELIETTIKLEPRFLTEAGQMVGVSIS
jgi:aminoglycoside 3-N-acetyltransferase